MDLVDRFSPDGWYAGQRSAVRKAIEEKSNWYQLILRFYELNPEVRKAFFQNFLFNASPSGKRHPERGQGEGRLQRALGHSP